MKTLILISIICVTLVTLMILIRLFAKPIRKWVMILRSKLMIRSLRVAINDADKDKEKTDRKNIVVFNKASGDYEPVTKKLLKQVEQQGKKKNNAKKTPGRIWAQQQGKKKKKILGNTVHEIEKKSLYVTE